MKLLLVAVFVGAVLAQQPYTMTHTSRMDTAQTRTFRNDLEGKTNNYRGMMIGYFSAWTCWWLGQYNALTPENKDQAESIQPFDSWLSQQEVYGQKTYEAQQDLADAATALTADVSNNLEMYPHSRDDVGNETLYYDDLAKNIYYTMEREHQALIQNKPNCGSNMVPSDIPLETYFTSFGLGRKYQYDAAMQTYSTLKNMLAGKNDPNSANAAAATQGYQDANANGKKNLWIIGAVVGPVCAVALIAAAVILVKKRKSRGTQLP